MDLIVNVVIVCTTKIWLDVLYVTRLNLLIFLLPQCLTGIWLRSRTGADLIGSHVKELDRMWLPKEVFTALVFPFHLHHIIGPHSTSSIFLIKILPSVLLECIKEENYKWNYFMNMVVYLLHTSNNVSRNKQLIYSSA